MIAVAVIGSAVVFIVCWVGFKILQLHSRNYTGRLIEQDADRQKNGHPEIDRARTAMYRGESPVV